MILKSIYRFITRKRPGKGCGNDNVLPLPEPRHSELSDLQRAFARLYATQDGKLAIDHLQRMTFMRALQADTTSDHMRHVEGQRALVAQVMRYILAGRAVKA